MLIERQRTDRQETMSTKVWNSSQSVVHPTSPKCMEEGCSLVQPIQTVFLDKLVGGVTSAGIEEEINGKLTTLQNIFPKHVVDVLTDPVKKRMTDQGCAPSFRSFHLSVLRCGLLAGLVHSVSEGLHERGKYCL